MITHTATEVSDAAKRLTSGMLREFSHAMAALGRGDLEAAFVSVDVVPVKIMSRDELGEMGTSFNILQEEVKGAALGLDEAREKMRAARMQLLARHDQIAHLAHHDALTDLPNRSLFALRLQGACERAHAQRSSFALLNLDLDHFKEANDVFGHAAGDELLCAIARRLEIAAQGAFLARLGGDEFTLILEAGEQPAAAEVLAARLVKSMTPEFDIRGQKIPIGLSVGAATYPRGCDRPCHAAGECRRGALSGQVGRTAYRVFLRAGDGSPPPRAVFAAARLALGNPARRALSALSAAGQDRW